jgi:hypothetical protein
MVHLLFFSAIDILFVVVIGFYVTLFSGYHVACPCEACWTRKKRKTINGTKSLGAESHK